MMKKTKKYYFSVEGETEQWYLKWLQNTINSIPERKYNVKLDLKNLIFTTIKITISSIIATGAAYYINNVILKLVIFSAVFLLQWAYPIYKYRERVFYKK